MHWLLQRSRPKRCDLGLQDTEHIAGMVLFDFSFQNLLYRAAEPCGSSMLLRDVNDVHYWRPKTPRSRPPLEPSSRFVDAYTIN